MTVKNRNAFKKMKSSLVSLLATTLLATGISQNIMPLQALANGAPLSMTVYTDEGLSSNQTKTITIPELSEVVSVTSNTGQVSYDVDGNKLTINTSNGTASRSEWDSTKYYKTATDRQIRSSNGGFASNLSYSDNQGYSGTLYQNGSSYLYSGSYMASSTMWVTGHYSSYYNSDGYSGYLSSYVSGSYYVPADSYYVSGQTSSYYSSGGYSGYLSQYLYSGSYVSSDTKYVSIYKTGTFTCSWAWSGSSWSQDGNWTNTLSSSMYYNEGGYSGTLSSSNGDHITCNFASMVGSGIKGSYVGQRKTAPTPSWTYYNGNVTKPGYDTRVYRYQGYVTRAGYYENSYAYQGYVTNPGYDTRQYAQDYFGYAYKGGYTDYYKYAVTIKYWTDSVAPTLDIVYDNSNIVNKGVIKVTATDDNSGINRIILPDGSSVNKAETEYTVTSNGTYKFVAVDNAGNQTAQSITIQNIDNQAPNSPSITMNESWSKNSITASLSSNGDVGASGVKHIEYSLSGAITKEWTTYSTPIEIDTEGKTTLSARVLDKAGNYSEVVKKEAKIDKSNPVLTVTPDIYGLTNTDVVLTAIATDTLSGVKRIQLPNGNWINSTTTSYTVGENGTYTFKAEDNVGNIVSMEQIVSNIKKNVLITNKREVDLELHAEDLYSGVTDMRFKNESTSWTAYESYAPTKSWVLSPVDGLKHVWVQYKDKVGNVSEAIEDIIILDMTKPTASLFVINDNDAYTKTKSVTLKLKGSDTYTGVKDIYVSNDNVNWTKMAYTEETPWTLSDGDGVKTVYLKVSDVAGNISTTITDTIFLDSTKPLANISINNGDSFTATRDVQLTLNYSDIAGSGVDTVKVIEGDKEYMLPKPVKNAPITIPWTLEFGAVRTVTIVVTDKAGNVSTSSDSIIVDKLTIKDFTLEEVVNPLVFNSKNPFTPKVWAFAPQPMLSSGNITFSMDIKQATDSTVVNDKVDYKVEVVGESGYHKAFIGTMKKAGDHYTQTLTIPKDAPNGAKVYVSATAQRELLVSPFDIQTITFPGGEDASQKAQIGIVGENIYNEIRFNEIQ